MIKKEKNIPFRDKTEEQKKRISEKNTQWLKENIRQYNLRFNISKDRDAQIVQWLDTELANYGILEELSQITGRIYESGLNDNVGEKGTLKARYNNGKQEYIKQLILADMKKHGFID